MIPLVTIGVPVYNGGRYVEETIRSLLAQDHEDLEILVADNASTDRTVELCKELVGGDQRVRFLPSERNRGAAWNYNRLLEAASGSLFKWAAADDVCAPSFVSACVRALEREGPDTVIAFPQSDLIDEQSVRVGAVDDVALALGAAEPNRRVGQLLQNRFEWHPVFGVIRTDVARATHMIGPYVLSDVVFLTEMALRGRFSQVPETLFLRRYHAERPLIAKPRFRDQASWFDTSGGGGGVFPQANVSRELLLAIARSELPPGEKTRCAAAAARAYILPHWRSIGGEVKLALRDQRSRLAGRRSAASSDPDLRRSERMRSS